MNRPSNSCEETGRFHSCQGFPHHSKCAGYHSGHPRASCSYIYLRVIPCIRYRLPKRVGVNIGVNRIDKTPPQSNQAPQPRWGGAMGWCVVRGGAKTLCSELLFTATWLSAVYHFTEGVHHTAPEERGFVLPFAAASDAQAVQHIHTDASGTRLRCCASGGRGALCFGITQRGHFQKLCSAWQASSNNNGGLS